MKTTSILTILVLAMAPVVWSGQAPSPGSIVGWGQNSDGQATAPEGNDFVAIAAGTCHSLALKSDGSIVGWGYNGYGQATPPSGNDFVALAAGSGHSLALKSDGSIVGWGLSLNSYNQASPPAGTNFVAIAAGNYHSLALKSDGSIVGWGCNDRGQANPPTGRNFVAIAAGWSHGLALKSDRTIVGWGYNNQGQATGPAGNDFVAIAAGHWHGVALKSDGSIICWGNNSYGQTNGPVGNDFVAIAAGDIHSVALKSDGSIVSWGYNDDGRATPPAGNDFLAIAVGNNHSLAIKAPHSAGPENDNNWLISGDNMYSVPIGNIGIGTTSPGEKLEVLGNIKVSGLGNGLIFSDGTKQITVGGGSGGSDNDWVVSGSNMFSIPTGNIGIGTTSPSEKLDVAGAANLNKGISAGIALKVNGSEALWYNGTYFSWGFGGTANFFADGIGIGVVDPGTHKLYVNGTAYATRGFWASDLRFKKNIKPIDSPIDKISNIRGVSFEWKRSQYQDKGLSDGEHYGVIAQEIEQVLPEIVEEGPNGDKAVSYIELIPILTEAIKEQQKQLEEQHRQIEYLLQRVESLERIVQQ